MLKAALYIRVSTTYQIDKDSLPFQRQELINYAKYALGIDDFEVFEDAGYSGKNTERPAYQQMMSRIRKKEFTHLMVWKIDRISRNLLDFSSMYEELKKWEVTFVSKNEQFDTSTAMGEAMLKIILVFAELERKLTSERVKGVMMSRAEKGLWNGSKVPLGYSYNKGDDFPTINPSEAKIVQHIFNLYDELHSTGKVANALMESKITPRRTNMWYPKVINDMLKNPFYIGTYRYNLRAYPGGPLRKESEWIVVEDNHQGIISKEQFERVNNRIVSNRKAESPDAFKKHNHVFSKLVKCGICGQTYTPHLDRPRSDGYRPSVYICLSFSHANDCGNSTFGDIHHGPFIFNYLANVLKAKKSVTYKSTPEDLQNILLNGNCFNDIKALEDEGLNETYMTLLGNNPSDMLHPTDKGKLIQLSTDEIEYQNLEENKKKQERALERLQNLFLFSDDSIPEKEYLINRQKILDEIEQINIKIREYRKVEQRKLTANNSSFMRDVEFFYITHMLLNGQNIDFRKLVGIVGPKELNNVLSTMISEIVVLHRKIISITFTNGITHKFVYKQPIIQSSRKRTHK
ncbi:recombinase family protein [Aminipila terrae]|uniref:Recombinase family protein n=1 Tax=Aminipila terrae TaxID=2697030 RepID=A0A6P1MLK0_9FIRM|nr:recombinase family protein [Aminipila terrae]